MRGNDLTEIVEHLKTIKAVGLSQPRARVTKTQIYAPKQVLFKLYNHIFCDGNHLRKTLKKAVVRPMHKKTKQIP